MLTKTLDRLFRAILIVVYLFILAPVGLVMRGLGIDYIQRRFHRGDSSYWINRSRC